MPGGLFTELLGHVRLNGALFYAHHGVSAEERRIGAQYEVDIDVVGNLAPAAESDLLANAFDYEAMYATVHEVIASAHYRLLETLVMRIVDALMASLPAAREVRVRVRKLNAPVAGVVRSAEVEVCLPRAEWNSPQ